MTTAIVSTHKVHQLCVQARNAILLRIKACEKVVDVSVDYEKPGSLSLGTVRSLMVGTAAAEHYKNLNFVLRLQELCDMVTDPVVNARINISLSDYERLVTLVDPGKKFSASNPYVED